MDLPKKSSSRTSPVGITKKPFLIGVAGGTASGKVRGARETVFAYGDPH